MKLMSNSSMIKKASKNSETDFPFSVPNLPNIGIINIWWIFHKYVKFKTANVNFSSSVLNLDLITYCIDASNSKLLLIQQPQPNPESHASPPIQYSFHV